MWYSGKRRRRHPHLENFLVRKLSDGNCCGCHHFSSSANYEPCVVSGVDPSHGHGPMPYFGYLVPTKEQLLVVRWPAKNVDTLVNLKDVINIIAVAGESPIFLFSPYKEKAQHIRICYQDELEETALDGPPKAIDVYLLDPQVVFIKYLRRIWMQRLVDITLAPKDVILNTTNYAGSRYYEWLLQSINRSGISNPKSILAKISRISVWIKRDSAFRISWWEDMAVFDWIFEHLRVSLLISEECDKLIAAILKCLVAILENADTVIVWTVLEPQMETLMQAVVRLSINNEIQYISTCIDILNSILWLPLPQTHSQSLTHVMVQALTRTPNWENCVRQILNSLFAILKSEHRQFRPEKIVFLFKTFLVFHRLTDDINGADILKFIRFNHSEDFRYYVAADRLSEQFPVHCKLKNLVFTLGHKLERVVLSESKYSRCS